MTTSVGCSFFASGYFCSHRRVKAPYAFHFCCLRSWPVGAVPRRPPEAPGVHQLSSHTRSQCCASRMCFFVSLLRILCHAAQGRGAGACTHLVVRVQQVQLGAPEHEMPPRVGVHVRHLVWRHQRHLVAAGLQVSAHMQKKQHCATQKLAEQVGCAAQRRT